ncbi:MAG: hypothetical protein LM583_03025, partial [Desulfurococcaceae archaeon]|nr:hypothetical protein [Desulfurococcaceae archaeon]
MPTITSPKMKVASRGCIVASITMPSNQVAYHVFNPWHVRVQNLTGTLNRILNTLFISMQKALAL